MTTSQLRDGLPAEAVSLPLHAKLAAFFAAIIVFQTVLVLGAGFAWSLAGLLKLPDAVAWTGAGLAFVLSLAASFWLWRRALAAEKEWAGSEAD